jgi:hypothetical protein
MYKFIGIEFWGAKSLSEFKKFFAKKIAPSELEGAYKWVKEEYKKAGYKLPEKKVEKKKDKED